MYISGLYVCVRTDARMFCVWVHTKDNTHTTFSRDTYPFTDINTHTHSHRQSAAFKAPALLDLIGCYQPLFAWFSVFSLQQRQPLRRGCLTWCSASPVGDFADFCAAPLVLFHKEKDYSRLKQRKTELLRLFMRDVLHGADDVVCFGSVSQMLSVLFLGNKWNHSSYGGAGHVCSGRNYRVSKCVLVFYHSAFVVFQTIRRVISLINSRMYHEHSHPVHVSFEAPCFATLLQVTHAAYIKSLCVSVCASCGLFVCVCGAENAVLLCCADSLWHAVTITQPYLCSPSADSLRQPALLCPQLHHSLTAVDVCVCVCVSAYVCVHPACLVSDIFRILKCCRVCNLCCGNINPRFGGSAFMSAHICTVGHLWQVWTFIGL